MTSATNSRPWLVILMFILALGVTSCSSPTPDSTDTGSEETTDTDSTVGDADIGATETLTPDGEVGEGEDLAEDETQPPDVPADCPDTKCEIGKVSCPTETYEQVCVAFDDALCPGVGIWEDAVACGDGSACVAGDGCACDMGECNGTNLSDCFAPEELGHCQEWTCDGESGCCTIQAVENCCAKASDCDDEDPCTQDLCNMEAHVCVYTNKADAGLCDDGDPCTDDDCDSDSGDCVNTMNTSLPGCSPYCWGSSQEQANQNHCTLDPCAEPNCFYEDGHQAWDEAYAPDCEGTSAEFCGICVFDIPKDCDDGDSCTDDSCEPGVGCVHELKTDDPACLCVTTADCLPLIDGPCQEVVCSISENICVKSPKDCEDGHPCTFDFCDLDQDKCIHQLVDIEEYPDCEGIELCYGQDYCDQQVEEDYGPDCPCKSTFCQFVTGELYGYCIEEDVGCDDDNLCTVDSCGYDGEVCACVHVDLACDDDNPCTENSCDPLQGCVYLPLDVDDGNKCTIDTCDPEAELSDYGVHTPVICEEKNCMIGVCNIDTGLCNYTSLSCEESPPDKCTDDVCDPDTGECLHSPVVCNDYNLCTIDFCNVDGICDGQPVDCNDDDPCTDDVCNEITGGCMHPPIYVNDFDFCTLDSCQTGIGPSYELIDCTDCIHTQNGTAVGCPGGNAPPGFEINNCTADLCDPLSGCYHVPISNPLAGCGGCLTDEGVLDHLLCGDNNKCTEDQCVCTGWNPDNPTECTDAQCVSTPKVCECSGNCATCTCDPFSGMCGTVPGDCTDCINVETGDTILCPDVLPDGYVKNLCTFDACSMGSGECTHTPVVCFDNNLCTVDVCNPAAGCTFQQKDCDDGMACTADTCEPGSGCLHAEICDDDDPCTVDSCMNEEPFACQFIAVECDDGDPCTQDICDGDGYCIFEEFDCDDGDPCTLDICDEVLGDPEEDYCLFAPKDCDDGDPCTVDICHPLNGSCYSEGLACDDCIDPITLDEQECPGAPPEGYVKNACTDDFAELSGEECVCKHNVLDPTDQNLCTTDYCDPELGIVNEPLVCDDDGDPCTAETCNPGTGLCSSAPVQCADDGDPCTVEACDEDSGLCTSTPFPCEDDGDACTTNEPEPFDDPELGLVCVCVSGSLDCGDGNVCTVDTCEVDGGCTSAWMDGCEFSCYNDYDCAAAAGKPGDVQGLCSVELCTFAVDLLGVCLYDAMVCDGGPPCTEGICDPTGGCSFRPLGAACDLACETDEDCDDGWACSQAICDDGICSVTPTVCDSEDPCIKDFCNPATGACETEDVDDCDSDCVSQGGDAWCDDDDACTLDWCDETLHQCMYVFKSCEDGDLCTADICDPSEGCLFIPVVPCAACDDDEDCDDGNLCTADICKDANPAQEADLAYMNDGAAHPARYCAHESTCAQCTTQLDCDAYVLEHPCVESAVCDTDTGFCDIAFTICDDGQACTLDTCNPFTGECMTTELTNCCEDDSDCGPLLACFASYCDPGSHTCQDLPTLCDDFNPCTADSCSAELGCVHAAIDGCVNECEKPQDCYALAYSPMTCTIADCVIDGESGMGTCSGTALNCEDDNPCTEDACVTLLGCQYYLTDPECTFECVKDLDCDDGNPCTMESCNGQPKTCDYTLVVCDDQDECTTDWCNPSSGACTHAQCPNCNCDEGCTQSSACDDGDVCTVDTCDGGTCFHPTIVCFDGDPCTDDVCDPVGGCAFPPLPECVGCTSELSCDDGNLCTANACVDQYCVSQDICE